MKYWLLSLVLLLTASLGSAAGTATHRLNAEPASYPIPDAVFNAAARHARHTDFPEQLRIGALPLRLEETQLSWLMETYPALREGWSGDAAEGEVWVCFAADTPQGRLLVWPNSGEMGGGNVLIGIDIAEASLTPADHCPVIRQGQLTATLDVPVWLGMSKARVIAQMGQPSAAYRDDLIYTWSKPAIPANKTWGPCETDANITIQFKNGRSDRLWVNRSTSC